jgi:hypothetical protein
MVRMVIVGTLSERDVDTTPRVDPGEVWQVSSCRVYVKLQEFIIRK